MDHYWWECKSDLAKDIHDTLKHKENLMVRLKGGSKLMYWRRYLVDWLALTCQKYMLNSNVQHLAVCLYDRFTDQFELPNENIKILILSCLFLASKFEEREEKIPKLKVLLDSLQWRLNASEYLHMEIRVLSAFDWHISFPTASHFKEYYMQMALGARDLHAGQPVDNREQAYMYLEKNVNYFLEVSLQDQAFLVFKPSLIMAACLAASRICLRIVPTWTVELQQMTFYSWNHLVSCIDMLLRLHDDDRKAMQMNHLNIAPITNRQGNSTGTNSDLDSAGSTPVSSPIPPSFANNSMPHKNAIIVPPQPCSSGYVV